MDAGNSTYSLNRGSNTSWNRIFYSVEVTNTEITIKERTLNVFQRALRSLFGLYSDTIWTQKKINHLFEQFPTQAAVLNDLVTQLLHCNKRLNPPTRPTQFCDIPRVVQNLIFNKLDGTSLGNCQQVCQSFNTTISANELLWKNTFAVEHGGYLPPQKPPMGWRALYVQQQIVGQNLANKRVPKPVELDCSSTHCLNGFTYGDLRYMIDKTALGLTRLSLATGQKIDTCSELPKTAFADEPPNAVPLTHLSPIIKPLDSTHFVIGGDMQASIWDASEGSCIFAVNNIKNNLMHADASRMIYYTTAGCLEMWDIATKKLLCRIEDLSLLPIQPTGYYKIIEDLFFTLMSDGTVHAYDMIKGEKLYTLNSGSDRPFTQLLATATHLIAINESATEGPILPPIAEENCAHVYAPATGKLLHTIPLNKANNLFRPVLDAQISDNQLVGIPRDTPGTVACWDLDTGNIVKRITPPVGSIYSFNAACPGRLVITTTRPATKNIGITIWDLQNESLLSQTYYEGCSNYFLDGTTVKIHNNIMYFGKWPSDKFHFWDVLEAKPIGTIPYESGYSRAGMWHFDGARFFISNNRGMQVYNLHQMQPKSLAAKAGSAILSIFGK